MMRFRLLGPVEVRAGEDWRGIGAPKWRSILAALLIHPGQIVSADTLISELWRDAPPARAANLVSIYVLRLRRLDGAGRHAEALEVYGQARDAISEQLGVDPGAELRQLHAELLAKDTAAPAGVITAGTVLPPGGATPPRTPPRLGGRAAPPNPPGPAPLPADVADLTRPDEQVRHPCALPSATGAG